MADVLILLLTEMWGLTLSPHFLLQAGPTAQPAWFYGQHRREKAGPAPPVGPRRTVTRSPCSRACCCLPKTALTCLRATSVGLRQVAGSQQFPQREGSSR